MRILILCLLLSFLAGPLFSEEIKPTDVNALIQQLGHEDAEKRSAAEVALLKLGKPVVDALEAALKNANDPEVKGRLEHIVSTLNVPLVLQVEAQGEARVGQKLILKLTIKNVSKSDQVIVRCLDGSTHAARYPYYTRHEIPQRPVVGLKGCGNCNEIRDADVVVLKAGESHDPLENSFGTHLAEWTPPDSGKYTLVYSIDFAAPVPIKWNGAVENTILGGTLAELLTRVPKIKLEAKVELEVKP